MVDLAVADLIITNNGMRAGGASARVFGGGDGSHHLCHSTEIAWQRSGVASMAWLIGGAVSPGGGGDGAAIYGTVKVRKIQKRGRNDVLHNSYNFF